MKRIYFSLKQPKTWQGKWSRNVAKNFYSQKTGSEAKEPFSIPKVRKK